MAMNRPFNVGDLVELTVHQCSIQRFIEPLESLLSRRKIVERKFAEWLE
jgi:hypothetical protein